MSDIRPLPIWWAAPPTEADYQRIREAKQSLGLPFLAQFGTAVPGSPTRVLAVGGEPNFICEYAEVPSTESAGLKPALAWVLGEHNDPRAMTLEESLSKAFGAPVREVDDATRSGFGGSADREECGADPEPLGSHPAERDARGETDPNNPDTEGEYRRALRAAREDAARVGE